MIEMIKTYLKRNAPWFGAIGGVGGFISDVLAPLANFALYLLIASVVGVVVTVGYYYYAHRDKIVTKKEEVMTKVIFFGAFGLIWGLFALIHIFGPAQGVVAATVPGVEQLQASLGIIQNDVAEIKQTTTDIKGDTALILAELQDLKGDLQSAQNGSITAKPDSAEAWYTNAVLYASQGDDEKAIEAYEEFFAYGYPYIDAYQNFNIVAKNAMSKKELESFYSDLTKKQPNNVVARFMYGALIKDTDERREYYGDVRNSFGDSSVLLYWMMNEYSVIGTYVYANELSAEEKQQWSTGDQADLKDIVKAYELLPINDSLEPYFINAFAYDGAKSLINSFEDQFADETTNAMLDNPVVIVVNPTGETDRSSITFIIYDSYKDIRYRIPGVMNDFASTIPNAAPSSGPWGSAEPSPELTATVDVKSDKHDVEVYWINANGKQSKTYIFSEVDFLSFTDWQARGTEPVWEYPDQE